MIDAQLPEDGFGAESRRLLHGRGGCFPGLGHVVVDWFAPVLLVTFFAEEEVNESVLEAVGRSAERMGEVEAVVVQDRFEPRAPKRVVWGELPEEVFALESGMRFVLNLERNQNHGFFLDMRPGRDWVRANAGGKRVLNLFAYTCSLSVAAIAGGAESVVNLDMAGGALATGRENQRLNFDAETCRRVRYLAHDLFKSWGKLQRGGPYDLVVIDPPSNQAGSFVAEKDYARIVRRLAGLTHEESRVLACLNSPYLGEEFLVDLFAEFRWEGRLESAPGFEDVDREAALKCLVFGR